ncbi:MAG: branched-chain amino acid transport system II carrier protein [Candidatus Heteroscillospira sp.]|jgi:LIVCS family branched-chain amino acid:cation transporter
MKLTLRQYAALAIMLFGLFFGAGNLIFPALMGQMAASASPAAIAGLLITGVGLPLLGIAAMGVSRSEGLVDMAAPISRRYSLFFTCTLYLTIGPLFAIPRTATVSFAVGVEALIPGGGSSLWLFGFSILFFAAVLFFSLRPSGILTWVGRILTPIFLVSLGILLVTALLRPMGSIYSAPPSGGYAENSFITGFLEGYNTLDALAALAFGIVVVNVLRELGVEKPSDIALDTVKAGIFSSIIMALIYIAITLAAAQSRAVYPIAENGGLTLSLIARHYFGSFGSILLAVTIIFACLKTAIGLVTSCSEMFVSLFPRALSYRGWAILFSLVSFTIANFGLNNILTWSLPVLMFLYPLAITLILLNLTGSFFDRDVVVFRWTTWPTLCAAVFDFIKALPKDVISALGLQKFIDMANGLLPLYSYGMGWLCPALAGLAVGLFLHKRKIKNS